MFVVITLPYRNTGCIADGVDSFGRKGFYLADDGTNRTRGRAIWDCLRTGDAPGRCRGDAPRRPYSIVGSNNDNSVNMVGHDDIFAQFNRWTDDRGFYPFFSDDFPKWIQNHFTILDITKQMLSFVRDNGYKICSCLRIIIARYTDRTAMVTILKWKHRYNVIIIVIYPGNNLKTLKETPEDKKKRILSELTTVRESILEAVADLPSGKQDQVFLGHWSIKDLLAHLIGWDYANFKAIDELREGKVPGFYAHIGKDWAVFNALLISRYKCEDFARLLAAVRESHRCLVEAASQVSAQDFDRDWQVRYGNYKVMISRLLQAEAVDERVHLEQIRSFLEVRLSDGPDD